MRVAANYRISAARAIALLCALIGAFAAANAAADTQRITLRADWNLVSFAVVPQNPAPAAVLAPLGGNFQALWAYDAANGEWRRYPQGAPGIAPITLIEPGRGYWLQVSSAAVLDVVGADGALAAGPGAIVPTWNLVGFPLGQDTAYEQLLTNAAIREIWTFDAAVGSFKGVVIDTLGVVIREDFITLKPGQGYWVRSVAPTTTSLAPKLGTSLPVDVDLPPLLPSASVTQRVPWPLSQGDVDVGRDGFYDRSATQRGLDFGDRIYEQRLTISNKGSGLLAFRVAVVNPDTCPWLRILETDSADGSTSRVAEVSGSVTFNRARIALMVTRDKMAIGEHECDLVVQSNGAGPDDAERVIGVRMRVGDLEGDYRLRVAFDTADGKPADLANPRMTLSIYEDADGLKAIIDGYRTLLIPFDMHLAGWLIESGTTRFELSGSFETPAADPGNPFGAPVRRDITIRGQRADRSAADGAISGSLDLHGEYFETIRGVTAEPIRLVGTFSGERLSSFATVRDGDEIKDSASGDIPDAGVLERTLTFSERLLIDEVDIALNLVHTRPEDLVVSLIAPDGITEVVLRDRSAAPLFNQIFDEFAVPLESLTRFDGRRADGIWTLRIEDLTGGEVGSLLDWSLEIRGTAVYDLAGSVGASLPVGTTLVLTGCGRTEIATTAADNTFRFTDLIECVYQIAIQQPGFGTASLSVVLAGADREDLVFNPLPSVPLAFDQVQLMPAGGIGTWFMQGVTSHDGGGAWQSGSIGHNQQTGISATVLGPGTLSFWWKVSSEPCCDSLRFFVDGVEHASVPAIRGEQDWQRVTTAVAAGSHAITWQYQKDGSVSTGADAAWLDEVRMSAQIALRTAALPSGAQAVFVSLTTAGGAGAIRPFGELQYGLDTASFDLDRLPLSPLNPGANDSDAFLAIEDSLTRSNVFTDGGNGTIDPPIGAAARRITINIGMPVMGRSVQADLRLSVGANP